MRTYSGIGMADEPVAGRVPSRVLSLAWNESALVAGTSKGSLHRLSTTDDTVTKIERAGTGPIYSLGFAPKGELLVGTQARLESLSLPAR